MSQFHRISSILLYAHPLYDTHKGYSSSAPRVRPWIILPYFGKRNQVTYHLNLCYWCFLISHYSVLFFRAKFYAFNTHPAKRYVGFLRHHDIPLTLVEMTDTFCFFNGKCHFCHLLSFRQSRGSIAHTNMKLIMLKEHGVGKYVHTLRGRVTLGDYLPKGPRVSF